MLSLIALLKGKNAKNGGVTDERLKKTIRRGMPLIIVILFTLHVWIFNIMWIDNDRFGKTMETFKTTVPY